MIKRLFQALNLLLVTLAVFVSVKIFYGVVEYRLHRFAPVYKSGKPIGAVGEIKTGTVPADYGEIIQRNLFNTARAAVKRGPEPQVPLTAIKQTDLNLKLWGTVATEDRSAGLARAVIEERKSREQCLYRVGDAIADARITEILRNAVVLDVNGRKEKLTVAERIPGLKIGSTPENGPPAKSLPPDRGAGVGYEQKISLQRSQVDNAFKNIGKLMNEVKIRPYYKEGETAGFVVANIAPESIVRDMGIKSGDVVTRINGQQIKTADDAMAFYERLQAGDTLSIELMRRGRPQVIDYTIEGEVPVGN